VRQLRLDLTCRVCCRSVGYEYRGGALVDAQVRLRSVNRRSEGKKRWPSTGLTFDAPRADAPAAVISDDLARISDDLAREVYCILGMPIDAIDISDVVARIEIAAARRLPFVISTPNLNFLVNGRNDAEFRESLLLSDLCTADGMPIVWIAQLMGIPIKRRTAGSDIFEALKSRPRSTQPMKVFLFGEQEDVAAAAAKNLNIKTAGLRCVGWVCPGWGSVDELSHQRYVDQINASKADFLVASLGAVKGQLWLQRNHRDLQIPVRAHLGATIKFQAGAVKRAPHVLQKVGAEWLWRIKEEPYLWSRYVHDGGVFLYVALTQVLPLAVKARLLQRKCKRGEGKLTVKRVDSVDTVALSLSGFAIASQVGEAISYFRDAANSTKQVVIDFSETRAIDSRFLGLLLMMRKQLRSRDAVPQYIGLSRRLRNIFRLNGLGYLVCKFKQQGRAR
jgi:N-acetylglucosaminyldiphosphoundecaprenol N-acetyl-beta-D-mannosaminyltransferase